MDDVRAALARSMEETRAALEPSDELWARWQRWLASDLWPTQTALVHGDLHPGHMLLDEEGRLTGVLDWTEARVTDPSIDPALFAGSFGAAALDELLARVEAAGGRTWPRLAEHAVERWAAFPVLVASWALRTGDAGVLSHARALLSRAEKLDHRSAA
jgi:aminoglycoside phosphotransferase (APT) family kinase protein